MSGLENKIKSKYINSLSSSFKGEYRWDGQEILAIKFQCDLRLLDCRAVMDWTMNTSFPRKKDIVSGWTRSLQVFAIPVGTAPLEAFVST